MKVLVTGGAGFIGSHLSRRLLEEGHAVWVVDNEATGRHENVSPRASFIHADVTRVAELEPVFAGGLDAVCHIAGQVSIIRSFTDPVTDLRTNTEGTLNVLRLCLQYRVPRLVHASSMTVYGNTPTLPTPETEPCRPNSYYGITKYAAECYVHATGERTDLAFPLHVTSLRMYSVYGPGQPLDNPYQGVLGIFLGNVLRGEPITIYGDGEQSRDFVHVEDIVRGWIQTLDNPASYGKVMNLGSGRALTINELANRAVAAFGYLPGEYEIVHAPGRPGEQRAVLADIRRASAILGWEPRVAFETGLEDTVRWIPQEQRAPVREERGAQ